MDAYDLEDRTLHQVWQIRQAAAALGVDDDGADALISECETRAQADEMIAHLRRRLAEMVRKGGLR